MKKDIYYCIVLSEEQLDFLAGSKYGIDRMKVMRHLIGAAAIKETEYEKKGFAVTLHVWASCPFGSRFGQPFGL